MGTYSAQCDETLVGRRSKRSRRAVTAVGMAAVLALVGCSGGGGPGAAPSQATSSSASPSTSASPIPTPTPTPVYKPASASGPAENVPVPVKPALADEFSKAGLEAFATYWYATLSYAYESGDTGPMEAITDPSCTTCANVGASIKKWHSEGRWILGGQVTVSLAQTSFTETAVGNYQCIMQVNIGSTTFYSADGSTTGTHPEAPAVGDIVIGRYHSGGWTAYTVEHLSGTA